MRKLLSWSMFFSLVITGPTLEEMLELPLDMRTCQGVSNPAGTVTKRAIV